MSNEFDAAYAKALGSLNTLHRAADRHEVAEEEVLRLRTQNDAIVAVLRERGYKGVDLAADVVALFAYCDGLSSQLADKMDRAKGLDRRSVLSTKDTVASESEWIEKVSVAMGIYYDYDGPFVAAESDYVVDEVKKMREAGDGRGLIFGDARTKRDPEPTPDIVRAFKGIHGEWRTHKGGAAAVGSRVAWADGYAAEADESWDFQYVDINLPTDEARRKWVEAAPCWDLPRTKRVTVEGVGVAEKK